MRPIIQLLSVLAVASSVLGLNLLTSSAQTKAYTADDAALDTTAQLINKCDRINDPSSCSGA